MPPPPPEPPADPAPWGHFAGLRPAQIDAIKRRAPIAYVPWGAIEWHSLHAPTGLDTTKAAGVCAALATATGGLVFPALPIGADTIKPFKGFGHTLDFSAGLVTQLADELCRQLAEEGFRLVLILSGHFAARHMAALQAGAARARAAHPAATFAVWSENDFIADHFPPDHAGASETSFQLLFEPGSVDFSTQPDRPLTLEADGLTGEDPRRATAGRGARQLALTVERAAARVRTLLGSTSTPE